MPVLTTDLPFPKQSGKVRDVYDLGNSLLIVSTDRISAFDWVLPTAIPDKGKLLTQMSLFWFSQLDVENHLISAELPLAVRDHPDREHLEGRSMVVRKANVIPFECVVRGYLEGSGWKDYQASGSVCGIVLPDGMQQCEELSRVLYTPATKAAEGHDENVDFDTVRTQLGAETAEWLRATSIAIYEQGRDIARERGILIADTKFEFGWYDDRIILIDEVLTPDSSRFWPASEYAPGSAQRSFDKQFVREFLMATDWDRNSPPPELPPEIVDATRSRYVEAFERLTGTSFDG